MIGLFKKSFSQTFDMAKSFAGGSTIKGRVGRAAGYLGAGYGTSAYIDHKVEEKKNYYGEKRFNTYFGEGAGSALSGTAKMAGMWYGGWAMLGRDPLARGLNTLKYNKARAASTNWGDLITHPFSKPRSKASHFSNDFIKNLKNTPRLTARHAVLYGSMAIGGGAASSAVAENASAQMSALAIGATAGAVGGGLALLGGWGARKMMGRAGFMHAATGAGIIGAAGAGGFAAAQANNNPIAEGSITDFSRANSSGVSRMNYSTAGLVQALHNNNRRH
tara:strand:+ start:50034 stop:50861 length:828 start_codon:yes stop_codon:yes gene_type:complete